MTGQVWIAPGHGYARANSFCHPSRFADVDKDEDRVDLRDGLRPAAESEEGIGSRVPADHGIWQREPR